MDTRVELVQMLSVIKPMPEAVHTIIERALHGDYHDFKSQNEDTPKVALVYALQAVGLPECDALAKRVMNGEFDEKPDAEDNAEMQKLIDSDPELKKMFPR